MNHETAGSRFIKALGVAVVICFLFSMLATNVNDMAQWSRHGRSGWDDGSWEMPNLPSDVKMVDCSIPQESNVVSKSYPYSRHTSFSLPTAAATQFLVSRGSYSSGTLNVKYSSEASDSVNVHVIASTYSEDILDKTKVCLVDRKDKEVGVAFLTPNFHRRWHKHKHTHHGVNFEVTVTFPAGSSGAPLQINNFETDLPLFHHKVGDLRGAVDFVSLHLRTTNMAILVESLQAENARLTTSNAPIAGSFNTSTSLTLVTSNSRVSVLVGLTNEHRDPTELFIKTSNAPISASVSLISEKDNKGAFKVATVTSNNRLAVDFPHHAVDSILDFDGKTSNAPAEVILHPAYEGSFSIHTSNMAPRIYRNKVEDPSGKGRERNVEIRSVRNAIDGRVSWDSSDRGKKEGSVVLVTSNSPVSLKL